VTTWVRLLRFAPFLKEIDRWETGEGGEERSSWRCDGGEEDS